MSVHTIDSHNHTYFFNDDAPNVVVISAKHLHFNLTYNDMVIVGNPWTRMKDEVVPLLDNFNQFIKRRKMICGTVSAILIIVASCIRFFASFSDPNLNVAFSFPLLIASFFIFFYGWIFLTFVEEHHEYNRIINVIPCIQKEEFFRLNSNKIAKLNTEDWARVMSAPNGYREDVLQEIVNKQDKTEYNKKKSIVSSCLSADIQDFPKTKKQAMNRELMDSFDDQLATLEEYAR